jgi:5-methylcytosine-specific restriction endonuclease McrA
VSEYYKKNREKVKAQQRKYRKENREKLAAQQRKYRKENHEKVEAQKREYRKENREKLAAARRRWREANPERYRASSVAGTQRRRAREENARQDGHTADDLARYWAAVGYAGCFLKGPTCNGRYEHIDHYVPLARGGEHTVENLVPACSRCNQAKHAKLMEEWRSSW